MGRLRPSSLWTRGRTKPRCNLRKMDCFGAGICLGRSLRRKCTQSTSVDTCAPGRPQAAETVGSVLTRVLTMGLEQVGRYWNQNQCGPPRTTAQVPAPTEVDSETSHAPGDDPLRARPAEAFAGEVAAGRV